MITSIHFSMITPMALLLVTVGLAAAAEPYEIVELRTRREAEIRKIDTLYAEALERLKVKYTKQGDLENANYAQGLINELGLTSNSAAVVSKSSLKNTILPMKEESLMFSNRDYKWGEIPKQLDGYFYMQSIIRSPSDINVEVTKPGTLYCAFVTYKDLHVTKMEMLLADGWRRSSFSLKGIIFLEKKFPNGSFTIPWVHPHSGPILIFKEAK